MSETQNQATYNAIKSTLESSGITFEDGNNVQESLSPEIKKEIKAILFEGFRSGSINASDNFKANGMKIDAELNKYCGGLISNWSKKDKRLNGNIKFEIKNSGSRAGQGDDQVKELRKLLKTVKGTDAESDVQEALQSRVNEVKASKQPSVKIDVDALPEHLRHLAK